MRKKICLVLTVLLSVFVCGCDIAQKLPFVIEDTELPNKGYDMKLRVYSLLSEENFEQKIAQSIESKYPNVELFQVTFPYIYSPGSIPDGYSNVADLVIHYDVFPYWDWNGLGKRYSYPMLDLRDLMKEYGVNVNDFDPDLMAYIQSFGENGEIYALPLSKKLNALYYNKDIFDQLGVPYPSNDMTWDNVMDLAQELTVEKDGIKYRGLEPVELPTLTNQLGLHYVDPVNERVKILDPEWRPVWDLWKRMHDLANASTIFKEDVTRMTKEAKYWGGFPRDIGGVRLIVNRLNYIQHMSFNKGWYSEYNESKLNYIVDNHFAMTTGFDLDTLVLARKNGHQFDMVALPTFEQARLQEPMNVVGEMIMISKYGHTEAAFKAALELLSETAQEERYYQGVYPSMKDPKFTKPFAHKREELSDTKLSSYFYNESPLSFPERRSKNDQEAYGVVVRNIMGHYSFLTDKDQDYDLTLSELAAEMARVIGRPPKE